MSRRGFKSDDRNRQKLEAELREERVETRKGDLRRVASTPGGRRLLHELLYDRSTGLGFNEAEVTTNGSLTFVALGKRVVAKVWIERLQAELPEEFLEMHREHLESKDETKNLRETAEASPTSPPEDDEP